VVRVRMSVSDDSCPPTVIALHRSPSPTLINRDVIPWKPSALTLVYLCYMSARHATKKSEAKSRSRSNQRWRYLLSGWRLVAAGILLFTLAGLLALRASDAASHTMVREAEHGQAVGNAVEIGDPTGTGASNGIVIQFRSPPQ